MLRLLRIGYADVSASCVAGLGALSFAGGILNLLHLLHPGVLEAILLVGAVLSLPALMAAWKTRAEIVGRPSTMLIVTVVLFCAIFALRYASSVHRTEYQGVDDYEAYLFFSAKMKALHFFAPDPFNERRLQSSIGVAYFLQQLFLARLPLACTQTWLTRHSELRCWPPLVLLWHAQRGSPGNAPGSSPWHAWPCRISASISP